MHLVLTDESLVSTPSVYVQPRSLSFSPPLLLVFFHDKGSPQHREKSSIRSTIDKDDLSTRPADTAAADPSGVPTPAQERFEFLLFTYLLRFIHREGRIGDFARAGLLFLFDLALVSSTNDDREGDPMALDPGRRDPLQDARDALGQFILHGDFPEVVAASLGATFSLLPTKLRVPSLAEQAQSDEGVTASSSGGMHLGAGYKEETRRDYIPDTQLCSSTDPDVRNQLDLLLKLFAFLQDIIHRCNSHDSWGELNMNASASTIGRAISESTLVAVESSFLDSVLYPSMSESSSVCGSAVAVLTYLNVIISSLNSGPLLQRMVANLLGKETLEDQSLRSSTSADAIRLVNAARSNSQRVTGKRTYTLKDVIIDNIRSASPTASIAALHLLRTLLMDHCEQAVEGLLTISRDPCITTGEYDMTAQSLGEDQEECRLLSAINSTDQHLQEVELYGTLISQLDQTQSSTELTTGYAGYLSDMHTALQADRCHQGSLLKANVREEADRLAFLRLDRSYRSSHHQSMISPADPLIRAILGLFEQFLCRTPDENVGLTGILTTLALCPNRSLQGWLLCDAPKGSISGRRRRRAVQLDEGSSDDDSEKPVIDAFDLVTGHEGREAVEPPAVYQILRGLLRQVSRFRLDVDDFSRLLSERRQGLLFDDHLDHAMSVMLNVEPNVFGIPWTPHLPVIRHKPSRSSMVGSLKSFLTPKKKSTPPSYHNPAISSPVSPSMVAGNVSSSPFRLHYEYTSNVALDAVSSVPIQTGPWSPARHSLGHAHQARLRSTSSQSQTRSTSTMDDGSEVETRKEESTKTVSLSVVLDNCVILEEYLKEIVSVITARRALGIDPVRFF